MSPTAELRWVMRNVPYQELENVVVKKPVLQQKWVQHHIPAGATSAPFEWRDVPTVLENK